MEGLRWRTVGAVLGVLLCLVWVSPNLMQLSENSWWPSKTKLNYGLDIQGGLQLVMGVDVDGVVKESVTRLAVSLDSDLKKASVKFKEINTDQALKGEMTLISENATDLAAVKAYFQKNLDTMMQEVSSNETSVTYRYYDAYMLDYKKRVIQQAIETIRNRVDEFGVAEPSISQQGDSRILVQLPGMADAEKAKQLINTTAKLDFMALDNSKSPQEVAGWVAEAEKAGGYSLQTLKYSEYVQKINEDLKAKLPAKTMVLFEKASNALTLEAGAIPMLLRTDTDLGGGALDDASVGYDEQNSPQVQLKFNAAGATKFADLTGANVGNQMAIVLDKVVKSAPTINARIGGGSAVITLGRTRDRENQMEEAKMIATSLRAGALPASLEQLEERRVGPTLGADSIQKAKLGSYIGAALVLLFMLIYYKGMGVVASLAIVLNITGIFALLSTLGATLTLPGIAAIALTVGFAVDANVLINERIKDELKAGASFKGAVKEGYHRAMSAILDANITTAATAVVLLYFGTGPVRGFAVNLLIGIATTMFANVFVSKVIVENLMSRFKLEKLSI